MSYRPAPSVDRWPPPSGPRLLVLIVDDHPAVLRALEYGLRKRGCEVMTATSYSEGLEIASQRTPHMALIDVRLAGAPRGVGLGQVIRERSPRTRVGLMTGWVTSREARMEAEERVGGGLQMKPVMPEELDEAITRTRQGLSPFRRLGEDGE